ncbi:LPXTG cell wall anchor domain-containing protein [Erysipelothrix anatis]|nr:LPXTG cell wall anchor domain-containing protein [Erysipelothrix anatis]
MDPSDPGVKPEGSSDNGNSNLPSTGVAVNSMIVIFGSMMSIIGIVLCFTKFKRRSNP